MSDGQRTTAGQGAGEVVGAGRLVAWLVLVGVLALLNYGSRAEGGDPPDDFLYRYDAAIAGLIQFGLIFAVVLWICRGQSVRELLALRRPNSWKRAGLLALAVFGIVMVASAALTPFLNAGEEQGLTPEEWDSDRAKGFVANAVVVVGIAPVVEELCFRGLGFSLLARYGRRAAIILVGVAFGLGHGLLIGLPVLVAFGIALTYLRDRTDSVYPPMIVHSFFNSLSLALALTL